MTLCNSTKDGGGNGCILCEGETFIGSNIKDIPYKLNIIIVNPRIKR